MAVNKSFCNYTCERDQDSSSICAQCWFSSGLTRLHLCSVCGQGWIDNCDQTYVRKLCLKCCLNLAQKVYGVIKMRILS